MNEVKSAIMQATYFLNGLIFNLLSYYYVILYWVKVISYENSYQLP